MSTAAISAAPTASRSSLERAVMMAIMKQMPDIETIDNVLSIQLPVRLSTMLTTSLAIDTAQFSGSCAYPGTEFYKWVKGNGYLVPQDWPQWVDWNHPNGQDILDRDITNICQFFINKHSVDSDPDEIVGDILSLNPSYDSS